MHTMAEKKSKDGIHYMSTKIDILHPVFSQWFKQRFPDCQYVIVFDDENTLFATVNGRRVCFKYLVNDVLFGLVKLKPKVVTVMYTNRSRAELKVDQQLFPQIFSAFDLIITADNYTKELLASFCQQGVLQGSLLLLQLHRLSKPVDKIFTGYPVLLIDDEVDSNWITVQPDQHGLKPYKYPQDKAVNARRLIQKLVTQIKR